MNIGFTYDEKFFNSDNRSFILKAKQLGLRSLELCPDIEILPKNDYLEIAKFASENGLFLNFHIPNFVSQLYDPKTIRHNEDKVFKKYDSFFQLLQSILESYGCKNKHTPVLVLHGEDFQLNEDKDFSATKKIIEYCLEKIRVMNLDIKVAIETLRRSDKKRVGDSHEDLINIIDSIDSDNKSLLGICLDICHDSMNSFPYKSLYSDAFLKKVIYVHAHGIDLANHNAHISLIKSSVNFIDSILYLNENTDNLIINLELLSENTGESYLSDLFYDLHIVNKIIN